MSGFKAYYRPSADVTKEAIVYLSPVTITIEVVDTSGELVHIHWLVKDIARLERPEGEWVLSNRGPHGGEAQLLLRDVALQQAFKKQYAGEVFFKNRLQRARRSVYVQLGFLFLLFSGAVTLAYFWLLPFLGEQIAMQFSKDFEISLGNELYSSAMRSMKEDTGRTAILNKFYKELHYPVDYPVSITVVESDEINAFAIPGGHIVVFSGILERMRRPEELAALLGHESSHVSQRHSLRNLFRSLGRSVFLLLVVGNESGLVSQVAGQLDALKGLQYSRTLEYEADEKGMSLMSKSNIDPSGMLRLMEMLQKEAKGSELPGFLQTHPVHADRIAAIQKNIKKLRSGKPMSALSQQLFHDLYE
jgi:predicted Zn-dependent protease